MSNREKVHYQALPSYISTATSRGVMNKMLLVMSAVVLCPLHNLVSGSMINLKFVEDYIKLSGLRDPLFILNSDDIDGFFLQVKERLFNFNSFLCYKEGKFACVRHKISWSKYTFLSR